MQKQTMHDFKRSLLLGIGIGVLLAFVFSAGFLLRDFVRLPAVVAAAGDSYPLLDEVQGLLDRHFVHEQPPETVREYAAIRGMLSSLNDRYTFFIEPPVAASEADALAGTYGGIGVQIKRNEQNEIVLYPYTNSPALEAGIENGDVLHSINGTPLDTSLSQDSIDQMLRGEVKGDSGVTITVEKASTGDEFTTFIPFAVIDVPSVIWRVLAEDETIGYVQITRFTSRTPEELRSALNALNEHNVTALVLDLRDNTGGLLQESVEVANAFIGNGPLAFEVDSQGTRTFTADPAQKVTDLPMTVLVNGLTASGAELVAGAIRDDQRGLLIGQKTYGKGTVQQIYPLSDKSSLHVTAAEWLTPNRNALDGVGLVPDIEMIPDAQGRDVELGEAVRQLEQSSQDQSTPEATSEAALTA